MGSPTSAVLQTSFSKDWIEPHIPRPSPLAIDTTVYFCRRNREGGVQKQRRFQPPEIRQRQSPSAELPAPFRV